MLTGLLFPFEVLPRHYLPIIMSSIKTLVAEPPQKLYAILRNTREHEMAEELEPDEVIALVFEECIYDDIRPKAFHKILYFVDKELEREHLSADLPIFWYMYGAVGSNVRHRSYLR